MKVGIFLSTIVEVDLTADQISAVKEKIAEGGDCSEMSLYDFDLLTGVELPLLGTVAH